MSISFFIFFKEFRCFLGLVVESFMSPFCFVRCKRNNYVYVKAKTLCKLHTDKNNVGDGIVQAHL